MPTGIYKRKPLTDQHKKNISISNRTGGFKDCVICNSTFYSAKCRILARCCSKKCAWKSSGNLKRGVQGKNKGKHWKIKDTSNMNKDKIGKPSHLLGKTREKSHSWIKDRTKLKTDRQKMYDTQYKYWMLEVKKRDKWKCRIKDNNCKGKLEAHHILGWSTYPELRYNVNNGISLCHYHHPRKRVDEVRLSPYFKELINII
jgi:hypothetical protein